MSSGLKRRRGTKQMSGDAASTSISEELGSSSDDSDIDNTASTPQKDTSSVPKTAKKKSRWASFAVRFVATWTMLAVFAALLYLGHVAMNLLIVALQILAFREISILGTKDRIEKQLPNFYLLHWLIMFSTSFLLNGPILLTNIAIELRGSQPWTHLIDALLHWHQFLCFCLLCTVVVWFVISLKPRFYRYQFKQLGWCLCTVVVSICLSSPGMWNNMDGMIWMLVPGLLIICNDIMAYMFGITFGKTQLIALSPNKTWEGAIGGGLSTVVLALFISDLFMQSPLFICPNKGLSLSHPTCQIPPVFAKTERNVPPEIATYLLNFGIGKYWLNGWRIADFQFHSMVFAMFAAVIGPFGGFFASGFKRAFKIKDFAHTIPGHGGITDRMDCQVLMASFAYFYRKAFIKGFTQIWQQVLILGEDEQLQLYHDLQLHLNLA